MAIWASTPICRFHPREAFPHARSPTGARPLARRPAPSCAQRRGLCRTARRRDRGAARACVRGRRELRQPLRHPFLPGRPHLLLRRRERLRRVHLRWQLRRHRDSHGWTRPGSTTTWRRWPRDGVTVLRTVDVRATRTGTASRRPRASTTTRSSRSSTTSFTRPAQHNIQLIPVFENYWEAYGGIDTRLSWEGLGTGQSNRWRLLQQVRLPGLLHAVPELRELRAQPHQPLQRRQIQGRPDRLRVGTDERAALRGPAHRRERLRDHPAQVGRRRWAPTSRASTPTTWSTPAWRATARSTASAATRATRSSPFTSRRTSTSPRPTPTRMRAGPTSPRTRATLSTPGCPTRMTWSASRSSWVSGTPQDWIDLVDSHLRRSCRRRTGTAARSGGSRTRRPAATSTP